MTRGLLSTLMIGCLFMCGCLFPVRDQVDGAICDMALASVDPQPVTHAAKPLNTINPWDTPDSSPPAENKDPKKNRENNNSGETSDKDSKNSENNNSENSSASNSNDPSQNAKTDDRKRDHKHMRIVPPGLIPGGKYQPFDLPPLSAERKDERKKAIVKMFPALPPIGDDFLDPPGPENKPLTLADLQRLGLANHPRIKQAVAKVEEAKGLAIQAGLPPNPTVGFESDTTGTTGGAGYVGGFVEQTIKTVNKLQLMRSVAAMDIKIAEMKLLAEKAELAANIRSCYFAVLVAQESIRLNRALVQFTNEIYDIQLEQVLDGGTAAPYEPMYLRVLATQARTSLIEARNRRIASWKQLAASMGLPGMAPVQLAGRIDVPIPQFEHQKVLTRILENHTDVRIAGMEVMQAKYNLQLQRFIPIPDVNLRVMLQKDRTGPPFQTAPSVIVGFPVPIWDKNQGNILGAQAALIHQEEQAHNARTKLTYDLAEAYERYANNRVILGYYRDHILPDLARVYEGVYERYQREPMGGLTANIEFTDIIVAQQNLAQAVATYLKTLGNQWQAVSEISGLLQTFDLFSIVEQSDSVAPLQDLYPVTPTPCCHPCSPLPNMHRMLMDVLWPSAEKPAGKTDQFQLPFPRNGSPSGKGEEKSSKPRNNAPDNKLEPLPPLDPDKPTLPAPSRK